MFGRRSAFVGFISLGLVNVLVGCQQPAPGTQKTTIFSAVSDVFSNDGDKLRALIKAQKFKEAADWYAQKRDFFAARREDYSQDILAIVSHLNTSYEDQAAGYARSLESLHWSADESQWDDIRKLLANAQTLRAEYEATYLFSVSDNRSARVAAFESQLDGTVAKIKGDAFAEFQKHGAFNPRNFFDVYPVKISSNDLFAQHEEAILAVARQPSVTFESFKVFAATYRDTQAPVDFLVSFSNLAFDAAEREYTAVGAPQVSSLFRALEVARAAGYKAAPSFVGLLAVLPQTNATFAVSISTDFGLTKNSVAAKELDQFISTHGIRQAVIVVLQNALSSAQPVRSDDVPSSYRIGYRSVPNPDYNLAVLAVQKAQQDVAMAGYNSTAVSTSPNTNGFAALGAAIGTIAAQANYNSAVRRLQQTPATLQQAVYAPYTYKKITVSADKSADAAILIVDTRMHIVAETNIPLHDHREFTLLYNVHADDENRYRITSGTNSEAEVAEWGRSPVALDLGAVSKISFAASDYKLHKGFFYELIPTGNRQIASRQPISADRSPSSLSQTVQMRIAGGTYVVPVLINGAVTLDFTVDSGAADVSIPADVVFALIQKGSIQKEDFLGSKNYMVADGRTIPSPTFRIRSLRVGNKTIENVTGSVAPSAGIPLLGQSFFRRLRSWSIDNASHTLVLQ